MVSGMNFSERIQAVREKAGITQAEFAKACKITRSAISQIESGLTKRPSAAVLLKISQQFGVSLEWLITGKGPMQASGPAALSVTQKRIAEQMRRNDLHPDDLALLTRGKINAGAIAQHHHRCHCRSLCRIPPR